MILAENERPRRCVATDPVEIFFEAEARDGHQPGVWRADIAEMPGLVRNAGDLFFTGRVAFDEPETRCDFSESLADPFFRKMGADWIDRWCI